jgi:hypothetical protein
MTTAHTTRTQLVRHEKLLLIAGFLGLAGATTVALDTPATGYEPSIYGGTPPLFWLGIAVAVLTALVVGVRTPAGAGLPPRSSRGSPAWRSSASRWPVGTTSTDRAMR